MEYSEDKNRAAKLSYEGWFEDDLENEDSRDSEAYSTEDFISGPIRVEGGTVPHDILEFHDVYTSHSYAYDCQRFFNLCVVDPDTVVFASGNVIHFFNATRATMSFRRCSTGGGIGHITKNPSENHIAVGENGTDPPIIIYEWPSMRIVTVLRGGTTRSYLHLAYSSDGRLLVSQGGEPDYMTTVWNWKRSKILLHCTSHSQDIYNAMFSPTVLGHLTTSGAGHIKFWKMARTFTGLKLQGEFGKFGKTEISDIVGFYPMPDEKVVSGCEWGNILLWDEELIKLEIAKKNRKPCHDKYITQFEYLGGELVSIGMDGWIRVWYYETIDLADPPDEDRFLENEPIYEFQIKEEGSENGAMLVSIKKQHPDDPEENLWYAQDGNGGMWLVELGTYGELKRSPRKLLTCHAGPIACMGVSTWGPFVATCGRDGHLHIYNYSTKRLIFVKRFRDRASWLVWFPCSVEATGSTLACAFESGVVRIVTLAISKADETDNIYGDYLRLIKAIKPHKLAITAMSLNPTNRLLVTGSEDCTIFVFAVKVTETYPDLVPIGYVKLYSGVSCMTWNPELSNTILVGCLRGDCAQVELPDQPQDYTKVTYELVGCEACCFKFQSVKSKIRRELARLEIAKAKEARRAVQREKMKKLQMDNPSIAIEEEEILADMDDDPPLPELYVPEVPNRVLIAKYSMAGTIWLSMGGYDAGYIYEYPIPEAARSNLPIEPIRSTMVLDADDTEISSCMYYHKYVFLGMQRGEIRVCRVKPNDHSDFSDYLVLSMHDNRNGFIPVMSLSHDERMLLTCGHDGNLFSYNINDEDPHVDVRIDKPKPPLHLVIARKIHNRPIEIACRINYVTNYKIQKPNSNADDIEELDHLTLEEVIVKTENDRIAAAATLKRDATLELLARLTEEFGSIIERNSNLPKTQQIPQEEFALDPRITTDLNNHLKAEMDLMHQKLAFDVEKSRLGLEKLLEHFIEPITCLPFAVCKISEPSAMVHSLRERKLGDHFTSMYNDVLKRIEEKNKASRMVDDKNLETVEEEEEMKKVQEMESFLKDLKPETVEYRLGIQINQMLRKYKARKEKMEERAKEWKILYASKPNPDANHPDDILAIQRAKDTIGDYKLKVSPDFRQSQDERETTLMKYKQLLDCRKKTHHLREDFQSRLRALRDKKLALQAEVQSLIEKLKQIHAELPDKEIKPLPVGLEIDRNVEFPEKNLKLEEYVSMAERVKATKRKKMSISEEIIINPMDEEYEVLLLDEKLIESERVALLKDLEATRPEKVFKARVSVPSEILKSLSANDRAGTPWERQMKRTRVTRKIHEQDTILEHVRLSYRDLDEKLNQLERERLRITADSAYSDLFLLTLHQQLIILKDFESMENHLMKKVTEKKAERERANQKVQATNARIDQRNKEIVKMQEKIKNLQTQFNRMTSDNKFGDFLRRIYKKKNKPLKNKDDKSSSASSTESSTDDDEESVASDDLAPLYLHESICPIGCDQKLYEFAFSTREERYECENYANEARKAIELLRKEIDGDSKKLKLIDNELKINEKDLEDFMSEKQRKLDDIDMTVILKFHQLQHFIDENNVAEIRDCVVFDKTKLSQLYTRVGELRQEAYAQKEKHNKNRTHLHRMKIDCKHMEAEIKSLKTKIQQEMIKKFGREVSLDALYEAVLRKMIHDVKSDMRQISKEFDEQIKSVKEKYYEQIDVLQTLVQDNTEKLRFFTTLEAEQTKLKKLLRHAPESEEKMSKMETEYKMDLEHLESTLKNLRQQKALFRNDIRNLRLKTRPLPPICAAKRSEQLPKIAKTTNNSAASSLDLLDLQFEKELKTVELTSFDSEDSQQIEDNENSNDHSNIVEDKEEDEEYSLTATMVHQQLSKETEGSVEDEETAGVTREMLKQVLRNVPIGGGPTEISEGIERSVDQIIASLDQEDDETIEAMKEAVRESLHEVVQRFEEESHSIGRSSEEIGWNTKQKIIDLSENMGLQYDVKVEQVVMKLLKAHDGIETAWDYLSQNVRKISDPETVTALREHAFRTLAEIKEEIENAEEAAAQDMTESDAVLESGSDHT